MPRTTLLACLVCAASGFVRGPAHASRAHTSVRLNGWLDKLTEFQEKLNEFQLNKLDEDNMPEQLKEYNSAREQMAAKYARGETVQSAAPWAQSDAEMGKMLKMEQAERGAASAIRIALKNDNADAVREGLEKAIAVAAENGMRPPPAYGQDTCQELAEVIEEAQAYLKAE